MSIFKNSFKTLVIRGFIAGVSALIISSCSTASQPGDHDYRVDKWSKFDSSSVELPSDVVDMWGRDSAGKAIDFTLDSITYLWENDAPSKEGERKISDYAFANDYLSASAKDNLARKVISAESGSEDARDSVRSLFPATVFDDKLTMSEAGSDKILLEVTRGDLDYKLSDVTAVNVPKEDSDEMILTVVFNVDVTYNGKDSEGRNASVVQHRLQRIALTPIEDNEWAIYDWNDESEIVGK